MPGSLVSRGALYPRDLHPPTLPPLPRGGRVGGGGLEGGPAVRDNRPNPSPTGARMRHIPTSATSPSGDSRPWRERAGGDRLFAPQERWKTCQGRASPQDYRTGTDLAP